jgi:hypothetical protein
VNASNAEAATRADAAMQCAAFPSALRILSILIFLSLVVWGALALPELRSAQWSDTALFLFGSAWLCIAWMGYWIVNSRTRLDGDTLSQTWLWDKRVHAADVVQMKLVHLPWLQAVMAPRLLVRQRGGALQWFQASDANVLQAFMARTLAARTHSEAEQRP